MFVPENVGVAQGQVGEQLSINKSHEVPFHWCLQLLQGAAVVVVDVVVGPIVVVVEVAHQLPQFIVVVVVIDGG